MRSTQVGLLPAGPAVAGCGGGKGWGGGWLPGGGCSGGGLPLLLSADAAGGPCSGGSWWLLRLGWLPCGWGGWLPQVLTINSCRRKLTISLSTKTIS